MKDKKDIFNGKIKKEYVSYLITSYIVISILFLPVLCFFTYIFLHSPIEVKIIVGLLLLGTLYLTIINPFLTLFVIRQYPKYPKLRRLLLNSDIYFTDSTSNEYFDGSRTIRGRMRKIAFETVTAFAEAKKRMGDKKSIRYTLYNALALFAGVLGLAILIAMPLLFENGIVFPNMSDGIFLLCYIFIVIISIAFAIFFLVRAYKVALVSPMENHKWISELYTLLIDIAVRKNNKKLKFWYDKDQIEQIKSLVKSVSENAELKLETKGNKLVSFKVVDILNQRVIFTGLFI